MADRLSAPNTKPRRSSSVFRGLMGALAVAITGVTLMIVATHSQSLIILGGSLVIALTVLWTPVLVLRSGARGRSAWLMPAALLAPLLVGGAGLQLVLNLLERVGIYDSGSLIVGALVSFLTLVAAPGLALAFRPARPAVN